MSLAPGVAEQAELYVEIFGYSAAAIVLVALSIVLNWNVGQGLGKAIARLVPRSVGGLQIGKAVTVWLQSWNNEFRRVRRRSTLLFAWALIFSAFAASNILTLAGTVQRADGVVSEWQRWAAYVVAFVFTTYAMAQYYSIGAVATSTVVVVTSIAAMLPGVFVTLTSRGTSGGISKVVNLSIWGPFFLILLIPIFYLYTDLKIWSHWWRGFPIVLHVAFAMGLWIVLWVGPEVAGQDTDLARAGAGWAYFVLVLVWYFLMLVLIYLWKIGPPRKQTHATDAVFYVDFPVAAPDNTINDAEKGQETQRPAHRSQQKQQQQSRPKRVVNLDPRSPYYTAPAPTAGPGTLQPQSIRGRARVMPAHQRSPSSTSSRPFSTIRST